MARPAATDAAAFYQYYISLVPEANALDALHSQNEAYNELKNLINAENLHTSYAPGKWTIAQLLQHVIDSERIFACRALWFARGSNIPFPGFDEKLFAGSAPATGRTVQQLFNELHNVRVSTLQLFESFDAAAWQRGGIASEQYVTVNALAFIIAGHFWHHHKILRERYL